MACYLDREAARRFAGAVGWAPARGAGPAVVDLTALRGWSAEGQPAITEAARLLARTESGLEPAAIPADGSLVPIGDGTLIPVHADLPAALAAHGIHPGEPAAASADNGPAPWEQSSEMRAPAPSRSSKAGRRLPFGHRSSPPAITATG
ncbi:anti-sigma factor antagonist [Streptomyces sp. NPDC008092]|uniref:anti-sigma factor antagonist n=1 Tax=Streptomyces sp. NPDC008092 TaxID=3364808 RepID=UPI0036ECBBFF